MATLSVLALPGPAPGRVRGAAIAIGLVVVVLAIGIIVLGDSKAGPGVASTSAPPTAASPLPSAPTFAPITLTGSGSKLATFTIPASSAGLAVVRYSGQDTFVVRGLAADGSSTGGLINAIGPYSGTRLFDIDDQQTAAFQVQASGPWTITVEPPASARIWTGASAVSGTGDDVVQLSPASSALANATFTYSGHGGFTVDGFSPSGDDGLVSTIGLFHAQIPLPDGTFLIEIQAAGTWSITLD
jgi:hypothetical protein